MYGKIINGKLEPAPNPMVIDGYKIYNPYPEQYEAEEFLEVVETEYPMESGKHYEKKYSQDEICEDAQKEVFDMEKNSTGVYKHLDSGGFF